MNGKNRLQILWKKKRTTANRGRREKEPPPSPRELNLVGRPSVASPAVVDLLGCRRPNSSVENLNIRRPDLSEPPAGSIPDRRRLPSTQYPPKAATHLHKLVTFLGQILLFGVFLILIVKV
ncbi:hypothetical protein L484_017763 [Morus notabilis]|uniref:Uncharacterized protein n=1 Tax=Morus notabilis TaxID=981085 RepID=W9RDU0_9ROSA|nr:hypothetical protein L484_017763 [Morus notabilis]